MKLQDITKKSDAELRELLSTTHSDLAKAVVEARTKEIRDVKVVGRLKKTIARANTIIREREIAAMEQA